MDIEKLIRLGHEIQAELGFHPEDVLTKKQREEVIKLLKKLDSDNDCDDKHWALLDVLEAVATRYGDKEDLEIAMERSKTAKIVKVDINTLKANPEQFKDKVKLVSWPDGKHCKHPSDFFKRNCLSRVGDMTTKDVAESIGVTPKHLSSFLNEEVRIEPNFAVKLAGFTGFCESTWLELQRKYDLYVNRNSEPKLR